MQASFHFPLFHFFWIQWLTLFSKLQPHVAWHWVFLPRLENLLKPNTGFMSFGPYINQTCGVDSAEQTFPRMADIYSAFRGDLCPPIPQLVSLSVFVVHVKVRGDGRWKGKKKSGKPGGRRTEGNKWNGGWVGFMVGHLGRSVHRLQKAYPRKSTPFIREPSKQIPCPARALDMEGRMVE